MENRYYKPEWDLDGTADELFIQARNNYIDDAEALKCIAEILIQEGKTDKAKYVTLLQKMAENEDIEYPVYRYQKDILDGCGSEEVTWGDTDIVISVMEDRGEVLIVMTDNDENTQGGAMFPTERFMEFEQKDFEEALGAIRYYNMYPMLN